MSLEKYKTVCFRGRAEKTKPGPGRGEAPGAEKHSESKPSLRGTAISGKRPPHAAVLLALRSSSLWLQPRSPSRADELV